MTSTECVLTSSYITECEPGVLLKLSYKNVQVHGANGFTSAVAFLHSAVLFCRFCTVERDCATPK